MKVYKCFLGLVFTSFLFSACKEDSLLNPDLIPAVDNIYTFFTDTIPFRSSNSYTDTVITSREWRQEYYGIGNITDDPIFGAVRSGAVFQLRMPKSGMSFPGINKTADSLVLSIPFLSNYGDTSLATSLSQRINVYRLVSDLSKNDKYSNKSIIAYNPIPIGSAVFSMAKWDSVYIDSVRSVPQLRIRLDNSLRDSLYYYLKDNVEYKDYGTFNKWFKGLYVAADVNTPGRNISYFNIRKAKMTLYTRSIVDAISGKMERQITDYFLDTAQNAHFIKLDRDHVTNNPLINNYLGTGNPNGDSLLFLAGNYGPSIDIDLKDLAEFCKQQNYKIALNKVEYEFRVAPTGADWSDSIYTTPPQLLAYGVDSNGQEFTLDKDLNGYNNFLFGGNREIQYENGKRVIRYRLNLARTMQAAMAERNFNFKIRIKAVNIRFGAGRAMIYGSNHSDKNKAKLNLIYTKLK